MATAPASRRFAGSGLRRVRTDFVDVASVMEGLYGRSEGHLVVSRLDAVPMSATNGPSGHDERSLGRDERSRGGASGRRQEPGNPPADDFLPLVENCDRRHTDALTGCGGPVSLPCTKLRPSALEDTVDEDQRRTYWRRNLRLMAVLLTVWALVSFGAGILFVEPLNEIVIAGFPLGFWFAQQGSIITFVVLIAIYVTRMDKLDAEFGIDEYEEEVHHS
jgi:putative solute:sodium symporter small subunit